MFLSDDIAVETWDTMGGDSGANGNEPLIKAANVDFSNCDREQVQFCGAIQPHGAMLVLSEPDLLVSQASANCATFLGTLPVRGLLGETVAYAIGPAYAEHLRETAAAARTLDDGPVQLFRCILAGRAIDVFAHRVDAGLIVEFEGIDDDRPLPANFHADLEDAIDRLGAVDGVTACLDAACRQVRQITGYDRVMVYQFHADHSGDVVAEAAADGLEPYLGKRFPASDIPVPARRLFAFSGLRHLPDVGYQPVPLVPEMSPVTGTPLDQSRALLRSVSPMYSNYLRNMGTTGTMVMPLLANGAIWGLLSCMHHASPLHLPYPVRKACQFQANMLALLITAKQHAETAAYQQRMAVTIEKLTRAMAGDRPPYRDPSVWNDNLLTCVDASGAAVASAEGLMLMGQTPNEADVRNLLRWLMAEQDADPVFSTDRLGELNPALASPIVAGLLAVRWASNESNYILWFRPEVERTVHWAGNPDKPVEITTVGAEIRLSPRRSFALWKQSVRGRSAPWKDVEIAAATMLSRVVAQEMILRLRAKLIHMSRYSSLGEMASNLAHELNQPLAAITSYLDGCRRLLDGPGRPDVFLLRDAIGQATRQTMRAGDIIGHLRQFIARGTTRREVAGMKALIEDVGALALIGSRQSDIRVTYMFDPKCGHVLVDTIQVQQVLLNLIRNAIEAMAESPRRELTITTSRRGDMVVTSVADTGHGISDEIVERLFQPFVSTKANGLGIGLSISRTIVESLDGRLWAEKNSGGGTVFHMALKTVTDEGRAPMREIGDAA